MTLCVWCKEPLQFLRGEGWRHSDGNVYKQRAMTREELNRFIKFFGRTPRGKEIYVDDHCALPE